MTAPASEIAVGEREIAHLQELYDQGKILAAHRAGQRFGPPERWAGPRARVLAGRILRQLGQPRLGVALLVRAWRQAPLDPTARYFGLHAACGQRGPYAAWRCLQKQPPLEGADAVTLADWLALHATTLAQLRDFERAEEFLARAEAVAPESAWVLVERAFVLQSQDRFREAEAVVDRALSIRPQSGAAWHWKGRFLTQRGEDQEALRSWRLAVRDIDSSNLACELVNLEIDCGELEAAESALDRVAELMPSAEKLGREWIASRRCEVAYRRGDIERAKREALAGDSFYLRRIAERLAGNTEGRRVQLPVSFIQQHHRTCAPATLAMLGKYWAAPVDHLEIADAICYDGTSHYNQRRWAEQEGYVARELTVTWEAVQTLIDRQVPIALSTQRVDSGHVQALIGYDSILGTFLIRDPGMRTLVESLAPELMACQRHSGPRGLVILPGPEAGRLDGLDLPDARLWDLLYELDGSLEGHDRPRALKAVIDLEAMAPDHMLALLARRSLAVYDDDRPAIYLSNQRLLERHPDAELFQRFFLGSLHDLGRRQERVEFLERIGGTRPAADYFRLELVRELRQDASEVSRCLQLLRGAVRRQCSVQCFQLLADVLWNADRRDEALEAYRFAACIDDKNEEAAQAYFAAARHFKRHDEVLRFLEDRFRRHGKQSSQPARTLAWAFEQLDAPERSLKLLRAALEERPQDGALRVHAAERHLNWGDAARSRQLLAGAEGQCRRLDWLKAAARLAERDEDLLQALVLWREASTLEPLNIESHRTVARLIEATDSPAAALSHLQACRERFPHNRGLNELLIERLRDDPAAAQEAAARYLELEPANAWARRERGMALGRLGRLQEAFAELRLAVRLEPGSPWNQVFLGELETWAGSPARARAALREALRLTVDNPYALRRLFGVCSTPAEREEAARYVMAELRRQTVFGEGLLAWRAESQGAISAAERLAFLREAHAARPDLWHAWAALLRQLEEMKDMDAALDVARGLAEKFPLMAGSWLELARVERTRGDLDGAKTSLSKSLEINPFWGFPAVQLARMHADAGDVTSARAVLDRSLRFDARSGEVLVALARLAWQSGSKQEALERLQRAIEVDAAQDDAWNQLQDWSEASGRRELPVSLARTLSASRPNDAPLLLRLAGVLTLPAEAEERLQALGKVTSLQPGNEEAHDLRAETLAGMGRFDEAEAECHPLLRAGQMPPMLRRRAAWVYAQRGQPKQAIRRMREALAEDPESYWGWSELARWLMEQDDWHGCLEAAEQLVERWPGMPASHGWRGLARLRLHRRAEAGEDFRRGIAIDPSYTFAARSLLDLLVADGDAGEAIRVLEGARAHLRAGEGAAFDVLIAASRGDRDGARRSWEHLCTVPAVESADLEKAAGGLGSANMGGVHLEGLNCAVAAPHVEAAVARHWAQTGVERYPLRCLRHVVRLLRRGGAGAEVVAGEYLKVLADNRRGVDLSRVLRRCRARLSSSTELWALTGLALKRCGRPIAAWRWLRGWRRRDGVEPWMLVALSSALHELHRAGDAAEVSCAAIELDASGCHPRHELYVAFAGALARRHESVRRSLARIDVAELPVSAGLLRRMTLAVLALDSGSEGAGSPAEAAKELEGVFGEIRRYVDGDLRWQYASSAAIVGKALGGARGALWRWRQYLRAIRFQDLVCWLAGKVVP